MERVQSYVKTQQQADQPENHTLDYMFKDNYDFSKVMNEFILDLSESHRCKILQVSKYATKISLIVESTENKNKALCVLEGFWIYLNIEVGSILLIYGRRSTLQGEWIISNEYGLAVFEPDLLVSNTNIIRSISCRRKSVFYERFSEFDTMNLDIVIGNLVHEYLQAALKMKIQSMQESWDLLKMILSSHSTMWLLYTSSVNYEDVERLLLDFVPQVFRFVTNYVDNKSSTKSRIIKDDNWQGKIDHIIDIEENIWSPELGMMGKVDISVQIGKGVIPLELKSGRATMSIEHRGQVILYAMMMAKLGYQVDSGLLLYLREGILKEIVAGHNEQRDLMLLRNELAYFLAKQPNIATSTSEGEQASIQTPELPKPINDATICERCPFKAVCSAYLEHENANLSNNPNLANIKSKVMSYLKPNHIIYFIHWANLIQLEAAHDSGQKKMQEIYTQPPEERAKNGKCIINVDLVSSEGKCDGFYHHTFTKAASDLNEIVNFFAYGIDGTKYVVVSTNRRPAVGIGLISNMNMNTITIALGRDLSVKYKFQKFHLDTYDSNRTYTFNLTNLSLLLENDAKHSLLRRYIIDKEPPTFQSLVESTFPSKCQDVLKNLNPFQQEAIIKALETENYLLIKGMPGTGKITTITYLIQVLVMLNKSVLITSHSNSGVDNVCLRLQEIGVDFLRLGPQTKVHPNIRSKSEYEVAKEFTEPEELRNMYESAQVIAVTCLSSGHPSLSKRSFDYCIINDSTRMLQSSAIRALSCSKKFILVGDPNQLPPEVKSTEAKAQGLGVSLFERLWSKESAITLRHTYRMNKTITQLANQLTYEGQLLIANDNISNATLHIPNLQNICSTYKNQPWIMEALDTSLEKSVQVINTGSVYNLQHFNPWLQKNQSEEPNINSHETSIVVTLINALLQAGVPTYSIGVITPYKEQVVQLAHFLHPDYIEVNTIDQFQGCEKEIIIYSCTKSKDMSKRQEYNKFDILEDKRNLTVVITKAKRKLIIIGDVDTLIMHNPFSQLFPFIDRANCLEISKEKYL